MAALVNSRAAVRLLGSASLRGDAVGRRGASSHADLFRARTMVGLVIQDVGQSDLYQRALGHAEA
jgi:hypothetical protein